MHTNALRVSSDPPQEPNEAALSEPELRKRILLSLGAQGFKLLDDKGLLAPVGDKNSVRSLHEVAVASQRERARGALERYEPEFIARLVAGSEIDPAKVSPRLVILPPGRGRDALLWRWVSLHWSIPVSGGYGRRIRALVVDEGHGDAVMGLIGLADPVYSLGVRDRALGWSADQRKDRLTSVMDAFVLGAVPPYNSLLAGKLAALLLRSDELRSVFDERYGARETLISRRDPQASLALVTTASALGRSSVYNRVRASDGSLALRSVGFTQGTGDFHFSGEVYDLLVEAARNDMSGTDATHRHANWGSGFRNRREVIQRGLSAVGLSPSRFRMHGVQREVFIAPLARNSAEWLRGDVSQLDWVTSPTAELAAWWKQKWMLPRASRTQEWREFLPESWRLWP
ncbi:DUF4338 domain-containing protein [Microbacterium sp. LWO14-1.2]|uniref:Druantia anti-phage system protein DruA n=1 Tax=Microbacterium sp. LWO14-1.2 TaxID=3135263 RepID=UPI003138FDE7